LAEEKKRKDYAFRRQFNEKPSIIPGCPGLLAEASQHLLPLLQSRVWVAGGCMLSEVFPIACLVAVKHSDVGLKPCMSGDWSGFASNQMLVLFNTLAHQPQHMCEPSANSHRLVLTAHQHQLSVANAAWYMPDERLKQALLHRAFSLCIKAM